MEHFIGIIICEMYFNQSILHTPHKTKKSFTYKRALNHLKTVMYVHTMRNLVLDIIVTIVLLNRKRLRLESKKPNNLERNPKRNALSKKDHCTEKIMRKFVPIKWSQTSIFSVLLDFNPEILALL